MKISMQLSNYTYIYIYIYIHTHTHIYIYIYITFNIVGLHSNIPHEYGLEDIECWLDKFLESLHPRFSNEFVIESVY